MCLPAHKDSVDPFKIQASKPLLMHLFSATMEKVSENTSDILTLNESYGSIYL